MDISLLFEDLFSVWKYKTWDSSLTDLALTTRQLILIDQYHPHKEMMISRPFFSWISQKLLKGVECVSQSDPEPVMGWLLPKAKPVQVVRAPSCCWLLTAGISAPRVSRKGFCCRPSAAAVGQALIWPLRDRNSFCSLPGRSRLFILAFKLEFIQFYLNPLYQHLMNRSPPTLLCGIPLYSSFLFLCVCYAYSCPLILHANVHFPFPFFFSSWLSLNTWMILKCQKSSEKCHILENK